MRHKKKGGGLEENKNRGNFSGLNTHIQIFLRSDVGPVLTHPLHKSNLYQIAVNVRINGDRQESIFYKDPYKVDGKTVLP